MVYKKVGMLRRWPCTINLSSFFLCTCDRRTVVCVVKMHSAHLAAEPDTIREQQLKWMQSGTAAEVSEARKAFKAQHPVIQWTGKCSTALPFIIMMYWVKALIQCSGITTESGVYISPLLLWLTRDQLSQDQLHEINSYEINFSWDQLSWDQLS